MSALPGQNQYSKKFWDMLTNQSLVAPVYLFMIYFASKVVIDTGGGLRGAVGSSANTSLLDPFRAGDASTVYYFLLANGLMMGAIIAAQELGAVGSAQAISMGQRATTWTTGKVFGAAQFGYQQTVGRAASTVGSVASGLDDMTGNKVSGFATSVKQTAGIVTRNIPIAGEIAGAVGAMGSFAKNAVSKPGDFIQSGARYASGVTQDLFPKAVDIFTSAESVKKDEDKRIADAVKATGKDKTGYEFLSLSDDDQKEVLGKFTARQRVELEDKLITNFPNKAAQYTKVLDKMTTEEKEATLKTRKEVDDKKTEDAGRSAFGVGKMLGKLERTQTGQMQ